MAKNNSSDSEEEEYKYLFQVVLIGDSGVGKSSILARFTKAEFTEDTKSTIGLDFASKTLTVDGTLVKTQIWDTAGQERYRGIAKNYYRKTMGALIVYDITRRDSFSNAEFWLNELRTHAKEDIVILLVGNKSDLEQARNVSKEEGTKFSKGNNLNFIETSARDDSNVDQAFKMCVEEIYRRQLRAKGPADDTKPKPAAGDGGKVVISNPTDNKAAGGKNCAC